MYYSKQRQLNESIPDNNSTGLQDVIKIDKNARIEDIKVRVKIQHPYTGDLNVKLSSPKGKKITLLKKSNRKGKNFDKTFTANELSSFIGSSSKGKWCLQVTDSNARDTGKLVNWSLDLKLAQETSGELFVPNDPKKSLSSKHYCQEKGKVKSIKAKVDIAHENAADLVVSLCSPSGKKVQLFKDSKYKKKNLKRSFSNADLKAFHGEKTNGDWTLEVRDMKKDNYGMLRKWSIDIEA